MMTNDSPNAPVGVGYVLTGQGSPAGSVKAPLGSIYTDQTGGNLYVKEGGGYSASGWTMK
jgi:hypothetical protein